MPCGAQRGHHELVAGELGRWGGRGVWAGESAGESEAVARLEKVRSGLKEAMTLIHLHAWHGVALPSRACTDVAVYNAAASVCGQGLQWHLVLELLRAGASAAYRGMDELQIDMDAGDPPSEVITYSTAMGAMEEGLQWQKALQLLEFAVEAAYDGFAVELHGICSMMIEGQWQQALAVLALQELRDFSNLEEKTLGALASAFERGNAWQMILQLLKDGTRHALGADGSIQQNDQKDPSIQAKTFSPQALALGGGFETTDVCGIDTCEDGYLLQTRKRVTNVSNSSNATIRPPNAQVQATYAGLNFALNQSKDFVARKIVAAPLIPGQTVSLGFGINLVIGDVLAKNLPTLNFSNAIWTEAGLEVDVEIHNLTAAGTLHVTAPESTGAIEVTAGGTFRLGLSTAVVNGSLSVGVMKLSALRVDLDKSVSIGCVEWTVWNSIPCGIISALHGQVPGWLVDSLIYWFQSTIEETLKGIVEYKLNENLRSIPQKFPMALRNRPPCLQVAFSLLGISHSTEVKSASLEALAENTCENGPKFPVPGLILPEIINTSMFSLSVSGSVPNSIIDVLHDSRALKHTVYPKDIPEDSMLGLNTNALSAAFYCPWLTTKYAFECPFWRPCGVSALIQSAGLPQVTMQEQLKIHIPLSVDFHLLEDQTTKAKNSTFLWRINLTADTVLAPSIAGTRCDQMLLAKLDSLSASWIDVTKTQDDSWVATALSINIFLPMLLNGPLLGQINSYLKEGVPLKALKVGSSTIALSTSTLIATVGRLTLATDVLLAEDC
ncbi:Uncharacterized protein SCF082_LOCUS10939 [Durusdinium trenchii]|uniref:Lipid-binding serum glycoprotein C-terminal domain-containing protein n=1 Tax=Durusdinium trenchii TaxID=1381693 RepID=A0ABP0J9Q9_9DINO